MPPDSRAATPVPPASAADTLLAEYRAVHRAEPLDAQGNPAASEADLRIAQFEAGATALCLSGGGIRSASFCLGVVQGLARRGLLARFDYLSTVSGGGYIGSLLAAWMYRAGGGAIEVEAALASRERREGDVLDTLRRYVRYLAPQQGFFSVDTWTLVATYVRNLLLNALIWLPLIALATLAPWLVATIVDGVNAALPGPDTLRLAALGGSGASIAALLVGIFMLRNAIARRASDAPRVPGARVHRHIQQALCGGALLLSASTWWLAFAEPDAFWRDVIGTARRLLSWLPVDTHAQPPLLLGLLFVVPHAYLGLAYRSPLLTAVRHRFAAMVAGGVVGFITGTAIGWIMTALAHTGAWALPIEAYMTLAPPAFLAAVALGEILFAGAVSRFSTDFDREWWARAGASSTILCIAWAGACAVGYFGPPLLDLVVSWRAGAPTYWIVVGLAGAIARLLLRQERPLDRDGQPRPRMRIAERAIDAVGALALAAILAGVAWLALGMLDATAYAMTLLRWTVPADELPFSWLDVLVVAAALGAVLVVAGLCVDVNRFSLHGMYRDRLIRTFLGASRARHPAPPWPLDESAPLSEAAQFAPRKPDDFIQFDRDDNPVLRWLAPGRASGTPRKGPFPIVNAALNLVAGRNLAWQERKAASFTFTPLSVGSPILGYRGAADYAADAGGITLGTAMAVSGAAVSPNAGANSSPIRTFILALCNARLGWWLGHPADPARVRRATPGFAVYPLVSELLGRTDETHPWLFVSDGGHFENLGLYEAVRRGCRHIVVVDASCDPDRNYDDLGNAIRKIRIDLGVRIERAGPWRIGARDLRANGRYCALFDVIYDDERSGSLLYVKAAVYPDADNVPIDVLQYAGRSETFPHESTARQFFTESQFESYRALGEFELDAIVEGVEMANRPDPTMPASIAEFIEIAAIRMTE